MEFDAAGATVAVEVVDDDEGVAKGAGVPNVGFDEDE
jgi:hypothetical protein